MAKRLTAEEMVSQFIEKMFMGELEGDPKSEEDIERMRKALIPHFKQLAEEYSEQEGIQGININDFIISKDKLSLRFFDGFFADNVITPMNLNNNIKPIPVHITVNYPTLDGVKIGNKDLTRYDYAVYNTLVSLYESEKEEKVFTIDTIYRNVTMNPGTKTTKTTYSEILESIKKLSLTSITIVDKHGAEEWGHEAVFERMQAMLMSTIDTVTINGYSKTVVRIEKKPILYWYASLKNQVARVPSRILATPPKKSKDIIALQHYLLERIVAMKGNGKHTSDTIRYDTLYEKVKTGDKVNTRRAREYSKKILDYWIDQSFIKGYQEKKGIKNSVVSLTITI